MFGWANTISLIRAVVQFRLATNPLELQMAGEDCLSLVALFRSRPLYPMLLLILFVG